MTTYDEEFLTRVFDSVTDPFSIYDRDFRIIRANRAVMALFQVPAEQLIGRHCYEVFYDQTAVCDDCHVQKVFHTGKARMLEKHISLPDGSKRVFEVYSYPIVDSEGVTRQAVEHARDVTKRRSLEGQLLSSQAFSEKIINSITDNLVVIEPRTHRILQANDAFHARVGLDPPSAVGKRCHEIMRHSPTPCETAGIECPVQDTIRLKRPALSDKVYPNAEGLDRMLEVATYPLFDSQGEISSIIRLERDVTEKRKMEKALAFRARQLQKTQHQLETLIEISRQVSAKNSLPDLLEFVQGIGQEVFSNSEFLLFLLDGDRQRLLNLEQYNFATSEPLYTRLQELELSGLTSEFLQYLQNIREPHIITAESGNDMPAYLESITKYYPSWFGFPVSAPDECIGYLVVGSPISQEFSREDVRFFQNLFSQIAGDILRLVRHATEIKHLRQEMANRTFHGEIIGHSDEMQKIYELIDLVAGSDATVLISGENGTGKELVAHAIHNQSHRGMGPFVVANCSAYSPALLESELFGHEKGAFTGAIKRKMGRIERAKGGTLFLDEIGDIAPATQVLLLRFLQDHCFERVGGEKTIEADVRVLAATNRNLYRELEAGRFRDDLYYRLNVITIDLPPLRDRKEDIPALCKHFLRTCSLKEGKEIHTFSSDAMQALMDHDWPGNVRQLENAISHAVIVAQGRVIDRNHLPQFLKQAPTVLPSASLAENERRLIHGILQECKWNKHETARRLKISRSTLYSKIRRYGLEKVAISV